MFHKEGYTTIVISMFIIGISILALDKFVTNEIVNRIISFCLLVVFLLILFIYKIPKRRFRRDDTTVLAPFDGKVVKISENEYSEELGEKVNKITIQRGFWDYRMILYPISGEIEENQNEKGKIGLKINNINIIIDNEQDVIFYDNVGKNIKQGEDAGFIKKCRKIDIYLPLNSKINVHLYSKIKGGQDSIASLSI
ncbi:hypothetical protein [Aureivirga sp. CE67]|uniref:hypothetical protein n=1 Tax=Aureivirga sp. CE67 TaxID=1788983 RepID=UPI0018CA1A61|nr:hypothetical protein [Aureivirga sp. CE67]